MVLFCIFLRSEEQEAHESRDPVPDKVDEPIQLRKPEQIDPGDLERGEEEIDRRNRAEEEERLSPSARAETRKPARHAAAHHDADIEDDAQKDLILCKHMSERHGRIEMQAGSEAGEDREQKELQTVAEQVRELRKGRSERQ